MSAGREGLDASCFLVGVPSTCNGDGLEEGGSIWCHLVWLGLGRTGEQPPAGLLGGLLVAGAPLGKGVPGTDAWVSLKDGACVLHAQS